ncbi:MAG: hypothetical protein ACT6FE_08130 [Methanosarcinaceae archaeon]
MVLFHLVNLNKLSNRGKDYPWEKPGCCPHCGSYRIWGHGFVLAFFDGFLKALFLKRYRCPDCKTVFRVRPKGYFPRFQASIITIRASIESKSVHKKWLRNISRTRQNHWYRALSRYVSAYFGNIWKQGMVGAFDTLLSKGIVAVTRSI